MNAWFDANPGEFPEALKARLGVVPEREVELIKAAAAEEVARLAADGSS